MKYFFDTEFIEDGRTIDLLSIGIVAEDGREFYRCSRGTDLNRANDWVKANVFPSLPVINDHGVFEWKRDDYVLLPVTIRNDILAFIGADKPEFWAYYADYDWVVLCQLFGRMIDLPKGWPMYCRDVKQLCDSVGNPKLPRQDGEHHALNDARWTRQAYEFAHNFAITAFPLTV